ncbi:MAG: hypothetical protein NPIRA05_00390 [Nitrospirales bacterium]|nr:MAG: hypothetical protein NPIRA05_00390 [Nitrospirales bacterium]
MRKYLRLVLLGYRLAGLLIGTVLAYFFGIFGLACHQNDSWNCGVMDIASNAELHTLIMFLLAFPFLTAAFEVTEANAPIVSRILWPVFGLSLSIVAFSVMVSTYLAVQNATF